MTSPPDTSAVPAPAAKLPPYRALLVVDIKDFSGVPGRWHESLTREVPNLLDQTFRRCGWPDWTAAKRYDISTGDGHVLVLESWTLPLLVHPFLENLQRELEDRNRVASTGAGGGRPLRMRVSLNIGPVTDSGTNRLGDGSGDARIALHRLLDADAVRHLLDDSDPQATLVAAILSSRAFEDAVTGGFCRLGPGDFVAVDVAEKTYRGTAYLRVPRPTGGLLNRGFRPPQAPPDPAGRDGARRHAPSHTSEPSGGPAGSGSSLSVGNVGGGVSVGSNGPTHNGFGDLNSGDFRSTRRDSYSAGRDQYLGPRTEHRSEHHGAGPQINGPVDRSSFSGYTFTQAASPPSGRQDRPGHHDGDDHGSDGADDD
ncbi:hypothetical protein [Frankia sp. QA3]|uniref:hypothetical protein n=1 Tax=Frankia sp. QA3 TaxID=710111 RepID=UPI000269BB8D|nr:hypothetical protein [Frankia sp. QA3]EIV91272.1 hypothetical protein FraQA3DRAFT_0707 [Frankia sp. QA3]